MHFCPPCTATLSSGSITAGAEVEPRAIRSLSQLPLSPGLYFRPTTSLPLRKATSSSHHNQPCQHYYASPFSLPPSTPQALLHPTDLDCLNPFSHPCAPFLLQAKCPFLQSFRSLIFLMSCEGLPGRTGSQFEKK